MKARQHKRELLISFISIFLCSMVGFNLVLDNRNAKATYHIVPFVLLVAIAAIGYWGWKGYEQRWVHFLWNASYLIIIIFLFVCGIIDIFISPLPAILKSHVNQVKTLFLTPAPFALLYFFSRLFVPSKSSSNKTKI